MGKQIKVRCQICKKERKVEGEIKPGEILIPLQCGHTYNLQTGWCYGDEQLKDREQILTDTINYMHLRHSAYKSGVMKILLALSQLMSAEAGGQPGKKK